MTPYERARGLVTQLASSMAEFAGLGSVLRVLEFGAKKYPDRRWLKQSVQEHVTHAIEHAKAHMGGIPIDAESGELNLAHAGARILFAIAKYLMGKK